MVKGMIKKMANSSLVNYTRISPNSNARTQKVSKITVHHMAGNLSVEACGSVFASSSRQASSNYGIGSDGRVGMYVEENRRSWASSSSWNDQQAITIEVANSSVGGDWPVSQAAWNKLVQLCADICRRYGFRLNYTGDKNGSLTEHRMYAATNCPGPYLHARMSQLANEVNAVLDAGNKKKIVDGGFASIPNQIYTGKEIKPSIVSAAGATYSVSYKNNTNIGYGEAIITGTGNWEGSLTLQFKILPKSLVNYQDVDPTAWYIDIMDQAVSMGILSGYSPTQLAPTDITTRANAVCMIANAAGYKPDGGFSDVPQPTYYYEAVKWAKDQGIINGNDGKFYPEEDCTRCDFVIMLYNWAGNPEVAESDMPTSYTDWNNVPNYGKDAMAWGIKNKILSGNDNKLLPTNACSRCEAAAMLVNRSKLNL